MDAQMRARERAEAQQAVKVQGLSDRELQEAILLCLWKIQDRLENIEIRVG